jgi:uncharacterized phiE125 gp8 family phage protein
MSVFVQPPFWAQEFSPAGAAHAVSVRVTPTITLSMSSVANPSVITTATPHGLASGDTVTIAGHSGSTPTINGSQVATVIDATHFSIPVTVTVGGTGGTVTRTVAVDPLSLAQAKVYARLTGTDLDTILPGVITTMRRKVEAETGIALLRDTYDVFFDALPRDRTPIALPWRPVSSVVSFSSIDTAGVTQTLAVSNYELDPSSEAPFAARLALSTSGAWPTDLRPFQPYVVRLVAGFPSIAVMPPALVHAVGLLVDAYVNKLTLDDYDETIAPYRLVTVA